MIDVISFHSHDPQLFRVELPHANARKASLLAPHKSAGIVPVALNLEDSYWHSTKPVVCKKKYTDPTNGRMNRMTLSRSLPIRMLEESYCCTGVLYHRMLQVNASVLCICIQLYVPVVYQSFRTVERRAYDRAWGEEWPNLTGTTST